MFVVDTDQGVTGLVLIGRGEMRFHPAPDDRKGPGADLQRRRDAGDAVRRRVRPRQSGDFERTVDAGRLVPRAGRSARAASGPNEIFREESPKSFAVDLGDLTRDTWSLLPAPGDFLAEIRTARFDTLTYARSASEPEDISLVRPQAAAQHRRLRRRQDKLAARGRFYNEDDLSATTSSTTTST